MNFSIQTPLENNEILLNPLDEKDFDLLYKVASDPAIWKQHPVNDRWKKEVFELFFKGGMESGGAYVIIDKLSGEFIGSTRFYNYIENENSIMIGFTFYAVKYWGKGINPSVKKLMINYIFQYVDKIYFQVGATNIRSQIAVTRLGAEKISEENIAYHSKEPVNPNFVYELKKDKWLNL
ncbi:GNAT family N-acetyltransferase [Apibacter sp. HY039]|uniref:GNAT family N-acetyltransferase n=1 Tax=Apibacter sp. HY039 TaxID=2501476 RepID=UPI000FEBF2DD|nr:GNAT family N-acetyltransferase [Apibacter sp. HY039]